MNSKRLWPHSQLLSGGCSCPVSHVCVCVWCQRLSGDLFAVKRLKKADMLLKNQVSCTDFAALTTQAQVDHVKREQFILARASNPFVVKLYYSFQSRTDLFLVLEFCPGGLSPQPRLLLLSCHTETSGDLGSLLNAVGSLDQRSVVEQSSCSPA